MGGYICPTEKNAKIWRILTSNFKRRFGSSFHENYRIHQIKKSTFREEEVSKKAGMNTSNIQLEYVLSIKEEVLNTSINFL